MARKKEIVAMLLAGGQGTRLQVLTKDMAKPAVPFGGKYRIIDFPLSNCSNSGISTVGVLTQFMPLELNSYMGNGNPWDLDRVDGGLTILPPYTAGKTGEWYKGTANAIYQNIKYIEQYDPEYVLILSGDHIYKMNYDKMLQFHIQKDADVTIGVFKVPLKDAPSFGIMNTKEDMSIYEFEEKPKEPKSDLASMGIYIFNWQLLKKYLDEDEKDPNSSNDFGKNIIPNMLNDGKKLFAYPFKGYWRDVGTIQSFWDAHMDLLSENNELDLFDKSWRVNTRQGIYTPSYFEKDSKVQNTLIDKGCLVEGEIIHSVIFSGVKIGKNSKIIDSVIMADTEIGDNVIIQKAIIANDVKIADNVIIGDGEKIAVVGEKKIITK